VFYTCLPNSPPPEFPPLAWFGCSLHPPLYCVEGPGYSYTLKVHIAFSFLGCIECMRCRLLLPICAVSVRQSVRPSVCLSVPQSLCHAAKFGGACSVWGVIRCSLCQITLASCYLYRTKKNFVFLLTSYPVFFLGIAVLLVSAKNTKRESNKRK